MSKRFATIIVSAFFIVLASSAPFDPAVSQNVFAAAAPPSKNDLDALLEAKDWTRLGPALLPPRDPVSLGRILDWLHAKLDNGAGFMVAFSYMRNLWVAGSALNVEDTEKDMRVTAGMIGLYTYELTVIDGAKCEDRSAPDNRVHQLLTLNPATFSFLKSRPTALKTKIVLVALAFEKRTALLRSDDDLICRDGLDQMRAGLQRGTQTEVPNTSGHVGRTVAVTPPPHWVPKLVPPATYIPMQNAARATMQGNLLKLIE
jgi:hypothetical protein